jgi:hypothetical protein
MQMVYGPPWLDKSERVERPGPFKPWNPSPDTRMQLVYGPPFISEDNQGGMDWNNLIKPWKPIPNPRMQMVYGPPHLSR